VASSDLAVSSIRDDLVFGFQLSVFFSAVFGESPFLRDNDLLLTGELELASSQSFDDVSLVGFLASNGNQDLSNTDTSNGSSGFSKGSSHSSLQSISSST